MRGKVEFAHKLLPDGESTVIRVEFLELAYELRGDADFVIDAFREISQTTTFVECMSAALEHVTVGEIVNAMRLGGFPDEYVQEFEQAVKTRVAAA